VLTVAGVRTEVHADGTFTALVPLHEGLNVIPVSAVDLAGNQALAWSNVTRDTVAPALQVDSLPLRTTDGRIIVSGKAEPGSLVTVDGLLVSLQGDRFSRNVTLSGGENVIVVRAEDGAGNAVEERFLVSFVLPAASPVGAIAAIAAGAVAAFLVALLLARRFVFPHTEAVSPERPTPEEPAAEGATEPEVLPEEVPRAESPAEAPAESEDEFASLEEEPSEPAEEDPRVAKLREAYESGKITRDVYEANLRRLGKSP